MPITPTFPRPASAITSAARQVPALLLLGAVIMQAWAIGFVPTDNNGDPNDYIHLARGMTWETPIPPGTNFIRWPGYSLFVKVFALDGTNLFLLSLVQSGLFLLAIYFLSSSPRIPLLGRILIITPAVLPTVAYMTKEFFPDSVLLSLTLLFFGFVLRWRYRSALFVALYCFFIKSIFIVPVLIAATLLLEQRLPRLIGWKTSYGLLLTLPLVIPYLWLLNADIFFSNVAWRPLHNHDIPADQYVPERLGLAAHCANFSGVIPDDLYRDRITVERNEWGVMPFGASLIGGLGCSKSEAADLQRALTIAIFNYDPGLHVRLFVEHVLRGAQGEYYFGHLNYMLIRKWDILAPATGVSAWYEPSQLEAFASRDLVPDVPPAYALLSLARQFGDAALATSWLLKAAAGLALVLAALRGRFNLVWRDPRFRAALLLLIMYGWFLAAGNYTLSDRFVLQNLFVLGTLGAVVLAVAVASTPSTGGQAATTAPLAEPATKSPERLAPVH